MQTVQNGREKGGFFQQCILWYRIPAVSYQKGDSTVTKEGALRYLSLSLTEHRRGKKQRKNLRELCCIETFYSLLLVSRSNA